MIVGPVQSIHSIGNLVLNRKFPIPLRMWELPSGQVDQTYWLQVTGFDDLLRQTKHMLSISDHQVIRLYYLFDPTSHMSRREILNDQHLQEFFESMLRLPPECRFVIVYDPQLAETISKSPKKTKTNEWPKETTHVSQNRLSSHLHIVTDPPSLSSYDTSPSPTSNTEDREVAIKACYERDTKNGQGFCLFCGEGGVVNVASADSNPSTPSGVRAPSGPTHGGLGLQVAPIIPFDFSQHRNLPLPSCMIMFLANFLGVDVLVNVILLCSSCHGLFDAGIVWVVQSDNQFKLDTALDPTSTRYNLLHNRSIQYKAGLKHPFDAPFNQLWKWHAQWAQLKRSGLFHDPAAVDPGSVISLHNLTLS